MLMGQFLGIMGCHFKNLMGIMGSLPSLAHLGSGGSVQEPSFRREARGAWGRFASAWADHLVPVWRGQGSLARGQEEGWIDCC